MSRTIVGLFDKPKDTQSAASELSANGFQNEVANMFGREKTRSGEKISGERRDAAGRPAQPIHNEPQLERALESLGVPSSEAHSFAEEVKKGGSLLAFQPDDARIERAAEIMRRHNARVWMQQLVAKPVVPVTETARPVAPTSETTRSVQPGEEVRIPIVEEQVRVGKREVEGGGVRVSTTESEKPVEEKVNLEDERVSVQRRKVDRPVSEADLAANPGEVIEVHERTEEPIVQKEARVVEEVIVSKEHTQRPETVHETVRKTDVKVEPIKQPEYQTLDKDFRMNFQSIFGGSGSFDEAAPAYRYGYELAADQRNMYRDWNQVEPDARREWESKHPGTWDKYRDAIHYSWDRSRSA